LEVAARCVSKPWKKKLKKLQALEKGPAFFPRLGKRPRARRGSAAAAELLDD
jgi:hypothetical protein